MNSPTMKKLLPLFLIVFALISVDVAFYQYSLPEGYEYGTDNKIGLDWRKAFQPATIAMLRGQSPYSIPGFYSPPWTLIPLIPLSLLTAGVSMSILFVGNLAGWVYAAARIGVNKWLLIPFFFLSGAMANAVLGNLDGLIVLGLFLPPWVGIPILMIKPQVGIPVTIFWLGVIAFDNAAVKDRAVRLAKTLLPFAVLFALSIVLYGDWFMSSQDVIGKWWNTAPFPHAIPLGVWLVWKSIHHRDIRYAVAAIPFLSPYISAYTWAFMTMALLSLMGSMWRRPWQTILCYNDQHVDTI
jgi:hypothetical protein